MDASSVGVHWLMRAFTCPVASSSSFGRVCDCMFYMDSLNAIITQLQMPIILLLLLVCIVYRCNNAVKFIYKYT